MFDKFVDNLDNILILKKEGLVNNIIENLNIFNPFVKTLLWFN